MKQTFFKSQNEHCAPPTHITAPAHFLVCPCPEPDHSMWGSVFWLLFGIAAYFLDIGFDILVAREQYHQIPTPRPFLTEVTFKKFLSIATHAGLLYTC